MKLKPLTFSVLALCLPTALAKPLHVAFVLDLTHHDPKRLLTQGFYPTLLEMENLEDPSISVTRVCNTVSTVYRTQFSGDALETFLKLKAMLKPCTTKGSAITQGIERATQQIQASKQDGMLVLLTDGGIKDDPQHSRFPQAVGSLKNPALKHILLVGLESQGDLRGQFTQPFNRLRVPMVDSGFVDHRENLAETFMTLIKEGY